MRSRAHRSECDLDVYLTVHLTVHLAVDFGLDFGVPPFADLPVYGCFLDLGCWLGPLFRPLLVPLLDRVSGHFGTRTCSLPYLNCSHDTLHIPDKSSHPLRVRSVAK
jgi:hypothetical protein